MIRHGKALDIVMGDWYAYQYQRDAEGVTWFSFDSWQTSSRDRDRAYKKAEKAVKLRCTAAQLAGSEAAA